MININLFTQKQSSFMLNISITADTCKVIYINHKIIMSVSFKTELTSQCSLVEQKGNIVRLGWCN